MQQCWQGIIVLYRYSILYFLVSSEDDMDGYADKHVTVTIIVGVSVFVSCVMIMVMMILAVTVLYKKRLKSGLIYIYRGGSRIFQRGGLKAMVICINYIMYILQLFTLLF